jgi:hypothetical protein
MRVTVYKSGHQHCAGAINVLVAGRGNNVCSDANDLSVGHAQIASLDPRWIKLNEQRIAEESWHP